MSSEVSAIYNDISELLKVARATACYSVTSFMIKTSGKIGQCIVEEESAGKV